MYDDDFDDEGPDAADLRATRCRGCGVYVDAEADRCPGCGDWMADEVPMRSNPLWVVVVALLMVFGILFGWVLT